MNVIDLFCGCGGMTKGLVDAGLNVVAGIDIWDKAIENYKKNFDHLSICADLTELPPSKFSKTYNIKKDSIDIIVGGPPCQGMSIAGKEIKMTHEIHYLSNLLNTLTTLNQRFS